MVDEKTILESGKAPSLQDDTHEPEDQKRELASDYPEGGRQAWLVVSGAAAVMFCTFGYLTGFGYEGEKKITRILIGTS